MTVPGTRSRDNDRTMNAAETPPVVDQELSHLPLTPVSERQAGHRRPSLRIQRI